MISFVIFASLFFFLLIGVPISVCIGLAVVVTCLYSGVDLIAVAQKMYASVDGFTLMAIPFFMLAGALMETGGMSRRLVRLANALVGTVAGGLCHVIVLGSCFFAALSGSSPATCAAIGSALLPEMKRRDYPIAFAAGLQAVAATIGVIIPPSIPFVVYGVVTGQSIGKLFAAGFIPGILEGLTLMLLIYFIARKKQYYSAVEFSFRELIASFIDAFFALMTPIIILGGIYFGIFTPTEAGAVACMYGFLVGMFIYRELDLQKIVQCFLNAGVTTAMVMLLLAASGAFSWLMAVKGITRLVGSWIASFATTKVLFLLVDIILLLILGCFMEVLSIILITTPILYPVAMDLGIDPIHFGLITVLATSLGMATPPVGENLYIASSIAGITFEEIVKSVWPFIIACIVVLLIVTFIPAIPMFIPNILYP
jgi:C4-dicarboxylate transporter DctM subunit